MKDFNEDSVSLEYERELSMHPKAGFKMSARDLTKFGQLYLNRGEWNGKSIIPGEWIDRITEDYTAILLSLPPFTRNWKNILLGLPEEAFDYKLLTKSGDYIIPKDTPWLDVL